MRFATLWPVVTSCLATAGAAYSDETWRASIVLFLAAGADRGSGTHGAPVHPVGSKRFRHGEGGVTDDITRRVARYLPVVDATNSVDGLVKRYRARVLEFSAGSDGYTDTETYFKCMCGVFAAAPGLAEARSRLLVPIFLAFMRDDYYGYARAVNLANERAAGLTRVRSTSCSVRRGDPDARALELGQITASLAAGSLEKATRRGFAAAAAAAGAPLLAGSLVKRGSADIMGRVGDDAEHIAAVRALLLRSHGPRVDLSAKASCGRLLAFLRIFSGISWAIWRVTLLVS